MGDRLVIVAVLIAATFATLVTLLASGVLSGRSDATYIHQVNALLRKQGDEDWRAISCDQPTQFCVLRNSEFGWKDYAYVVGDDGAVKAVVFSG